MSHVTCAFFNVPDVRVVSIERYRSSFPWLSLLELVAGRIGTAYGDLLTDQSEVFTSGIHTATLDPLHRYANAIRCELPEVITVLGVFYARVARWGAGRLAAPAGAA